MLEREKEKNIVDGEIEGEVEKTMEQRQEKNKNTAAKAKSDRKLFYTIRSQKKDLIKELAQKKNDETHLKKECTLYYKNRTAFETRP